MSIELKELTNGVEFEYLMNKYAECNEKYFNALIQSKKVNKVENKIKRFRKICASALDSEQFGDVHVKKRDKEMMKLAVLLELFNRDVASFAERHYMQPEQVQELIDSKTYLAGV